MPLGRSCLVLLLSVAVGWGAELRTLKKETFKGDLVSVSDKEVVFSTGGAPMTLPVLQVMEIELAPQPKPAEGVKFAEVELVDGSLLRCGSVLIKGKEAELVLLGSKEPPIKLSLALVRSILYAGHDPKLRKEWAEKLATKKTKDGIGLMSGDVLNVFDGFLGEGDAEGKTIEFTLEGSTPKKRNVANLIGLVFYRVTDPQAPPVVFRLHDDSGSLILVSKASTGPNGLSVTTPGGYKMDVPMARLTKLDFSKGKITYLSDLKPRTNYSSTEDLVQEYQRDKNLEGSGPIRIKGETYDKGLAIHATSSLEYDLDGDYRQFLASVGIDDAVGGVDGPIVLLIEGINDREVKKLLEMTVTRHDKDKVRPVNLNIKDFTKLRITVSSGDLLDLGKHLDLGDAHVSKGGSER
jgi:hypothetical protein